MNGRQKFKGNHIYFKVKRQTSRNFRLKRQSDLKVYFQDERHVFLTNWHSNFDIYFPIIKIRKVLLRGKKNIAARKSRKKKNNNFISNTILTITFY